MEVVVETTIRYGNQTFRVGDLVTISYRGTHSVSGIIRAIGPGAVQIGDGNVIPCKWIEQIKGAL